MYLLVFQIKETKWIGTILISWKVVGLFRAMLFAYIAQKDN